jgi:hypothetical protein
MWMWVKFCPGLLERFGPKLGLKFFFILEFTPRDGLAKIELGKQRLELVGKICFYIYMA